MLQFIIQWFFTFIISLSAYLLLSLEPLVGRLLLPYFGSVQSVWLTCLMFFQVTLFLGYLYAHLLTRAKMRSVIHGALLVAALILRPQINSSLLEYAASYSHPSVGVLVALISMVGIPFFVLATCAPLVQRLYAERYQSSPYALYSASNVGSLLGLLSYPFLIEPLMALSVQVAWWDCAFAVLIFGLAVLFFLSRTPSSEERSIVCATSTRQKILWLFTAAIPSSLLMGTTTYLTTDIASIPLLWVLPLSLYLITFIIAFSGRDGPPPRWLTRAFRFLAIATLTALIMGVNQPALLLIVLNLALLFVASLVCHRCLVSSKPHEAEVTNFYVYVAAGGALGGIFNAACAPLLFTNILEYPLAILLCALFVQWQPVESWKSALKPVLPVVALALVLLVLSRWSGWYFMRSETMTRIGLTALVIMAYRLQNKGVSFAMALSVISVAGSWFANPVYQNLVDSRRDFYGVLRVHDTTDGFRTLVHGRVVHGREQHALKGRCEPDGYYCRRSPLVAAVEEAQKIPGPRKVALIGVGTGNSICYATREETWDLYELSPAVNEFALQYFSYLPHNNAGERRTFLGDGRLELSKSREQYALIVVDGFSSDSIPIHLLTKEAMKGYLDHLTPQGVIAFHISNQYFQLAQPLADVAATLRLHAYLKAVDLGGDCLPSRWVMVTKEGRALPGWIALQGSPERAWSDEQSYLLSALEWH